jgi:ferrous iron transport protein A
MMLTEWKAESYNKGRRNSMMPLIYAEKDQPQIIRKLGGSPEVRKHLEDLGFHIGGEVSIVSSLGDNLILKVKESRVAVSEELARKIMV